MREVTLTEEKEIQISLLKEFLNICKKNDLVYFLGGGTLLGSVRHKGYIPWDDDIDVMMPREDYEKLIAIFNYQCSNNIKLLDYKNTEDYYYSFAKIVDLRTKLVENGLEEIKEMGVYIDVFPLDYLPDNTKKIKKITYQYRKYYKIVFYNKCIDFSKSSKSFIKKIIKKILIMFLKNKKTLKKCLKKIDELGVREKTNMVTCLSGRYGEKEIMPSSYIDGYLESEFEGLKCNIPVGYDLYLKKHYGDYMELPPKEKQISNHDNIAYWR